MKLYQLSAFALLCIPTLHTSDHNNQISSRRTQSAQTLAWQAKQDETRPQMQTQMPIHRWRILEALGCFACMRQTPAEQQTIFTDINQATTHAPHTHITRHHKKKKRTTKVHYITPRRHADVLNLEDIENSTEQDIETKHEYLSTNEQNFDTAILPGTPATPPAQLPTFTRTFVSQILQRRGSSDDESDTNAHQETKNPLPPTSPLITLAHTPRTPPRDERHQGPQQRPTSAHNYISLRTIIESKNNQIENLKNEIAYLQAEIDKLKQQLARFTLLARVKPEMKDQATNTKKRHPHDQSTQSNMDMSHMHETYEQCIQCLKNLAPTDEYIQDEIVDLMDLVIQIKQKLRYAAQTEYVQRLLDVKNIEGSVLDFARALGPKP